MNPRCDACSDPLGTCWACGNASACTSHGCRVCRAPYTMPVEHTALPESPPEERRQALVPPLQMAADSAKLRLRKIADGVYKVDTTAALVIISLDADKGYSVQSKVGRRWRTLGTWKRAARAVESARGASW